MPVLTSEGFRIAYEVYGEGAPVVLVHGFASNGRVNWLDTGWVDSLNSAGYQVVTIDNRGHGDSEKIYDNTKYDSRQMAVDVANLIDHLGLGRAAVMGYSMGGRISTFAAIDASDKVAALVIGGLGYALVKGMSSSQEITEALLAPSLEDVEGKTGRTFRRFAESTKSDLKALAACMSSGRSPVLPADLAKLEMPVLIAVGTEDEVAGSPHELAELISGAEVLEIPRRDHMRATGDPVFKAGVIDFLARNYPANRNS